MAFNGLAPLSNMVSYGFSRLINTLGETAPRAITGLWAMRGSKRSYLGGCQVRPLTQKEAGPPVVGRVAVRRQADDVR